MSDIQNFNDFNNVTEPTEAGTNAAGVLLSDTFENWREKTNGIIAEINVLATQLNTQVDVPLSGIVQASGKKLIGNVTGSTADLAEISIIAESDKIISNDNDTTIPTSAAVHDFQEKRYISGRVSSSGVATSLHGISSVRVGTGAYNITVNGSHQLPAGQRYTVVAQLAIDLAPYGATQSRINNQFQIQLFQIDDISGDPAYRAEIFELESYEGHGGGNDANSASFVSVNRRDFPFTLIGLPATDQ